MLEQARSPLQIKGLAAPLLRPLPTLLTYVKLTANAGHCGNSAGRRLFSVHLRAFKAMLVALTRSARMPADAIGPLLNRCKDMEQAGFWDLSDVLDGFLQDLRGLHSEFGPLMKEAARELSADLGRLFRGETGPICLVTLFNDQTGPLAEKVQVKLVDDCWYENELRHETEGLGWLDSCDLVLLASGETPLRQDIELAVKKAQIPTLVLFDVGTTGKKKSMATLRTEHLYRQKGFRVLHGPFVPVRLYQAIDGCLVRHLLSRAAPLPSLEAVGN